MFDDPTKDEDVNESVYGQSNVCLVSLSRLVGVLSYARSTVLPSSSLSTSFRLISLIPIWLMHNFLTLLILMFCLTMLRDPELCYSTLKGSISFLTAFSNVLETIGESAKL